MTKGIWCQYWVTVKSVAGFLIYYSCYWNVVVDGAWEKGSSIYQAPTGKSGTMCLLQSRIPLAYLIGWKFAERNWKPWDEFLFNGRILKISIFNKNFVIWQSSVEILGLIACLMFSEDKWASRPTISMNSLALDI